MAKTRRKYKGNATSATISAGLSAGATSATISSNTGWPTSGPFYCVVDPGTSTEEKILVGSISGTSISSITRGVDDTSDQNHASGCTIYPVFTAVDADEANELTSTYANQGGIVYQGASTFAQLAIGTAGQVMKVNSGATAPEWGQVATAGIADDAVTSAKIAADAVGSSEIAANAVTATEIASDAVTTAKILDSNVTTAKIADDAVTAAKIATGAVGSTELATDSVTTVKITDANVTAAKLASDSVTTAKIVDANVTNAKLNNGASGDVALVTVSTSDPTGGKNGDIWVKVV